MYIQVNIGRNIGNTPMSDHQWDTFRLAVSQAICLSVRTDDYAPESGNELHRGVGYWQYREEESAHISRYDERGYDLVQLRNDLRGLANQFGQGNIALIVGSELIEADAEHHFVCGLYYTSGFLKSHSDFCNRYNR